jgi:proline iminopeptidase
MQYSLYPIVEPYKTGRLKVSPLHDLYYEEVGNPEGPPIVFVHGGPGGGISPDCRTFFDPQFYRIILFDQRGAGKSTPHAEIKDNTTWDLVADMEKLREQLKIHSWIVFGGSWGSTLALAYAETHPQRVKGLILRGIFLCRDEEIQWFYQKGASFLFADEWDKYLAPIPESERHDMVTAYYSRLTHADPRVRNEAALAWTVWEASTSKLLKDMSFMERYEELNFALAFARIECHYFVNRAFFKPHDQLLRDAHKLRSIPTEIVQGRYDVVCPMKSAWDLCKELPQAQLHIVPAAGHSAFETDIARKLVEVTERFKTLA